MSETATATAPLVDTRKPRRYMPGWYSVAWGSALLVMLPVLAVLWLALFPTENIWPHLVDTILPVYIRSTLLLLAGVGSLSVVIGVSVPPGL